MLNTSTYFDIVCALPVAPLFAPAKPILLCTPLVLCCLPKFAFSGAAAAVLYCPVFLSPLTVRSHAASRIYPTSSYNPALSLCYL